MTTDTLMTDATNSTESVTSQQATESTTAVDEGGQNATTESVVDQTATAADGQDKPQGAPESYEFQPLENVIVDEAIIKTYAEAAKELDLPQDKAQQMLAKMGPAIAARQAEQIAAVRAQWETESVADKEFGGEKLQENLAYAFKARDTFATPELRALLNETGLGNHPEIIRLFYRTGKAISEDGFIAGRTAPTSEVSQAKRLFPNMA